jgi:hypothetical protein
MQKFYVAPIFSRSGEIFQRGFSVTWRKVIVIPTALNPDLRPFSRSD